MGERVLERARNERKRNGRPVRAARRSLDSCVGRRGERRDYWVTIGATGAGITIGSGAGGTTGAGATIGAGAGGGATIFFTTFFFGAAFFTAFVTAGFATFLTAFLIAARLGAAFFTAFLILFGAAFFFGTAFFFGAAIFRTVFLTAFFTVRFFAICSSFNGGRTCGRVARAIIAQLARRTSRFPGARRRYVMLRRGATPVRLTKAVILARGLGTRMRRAAPEAPLEGAQARAADSGVKGMIPVGRPFLDYVISALADAGFEDVCLVVAPGAGAIREHYGREAPPARVRLAFAVQTAPRGTADAVGAAGEFAAGGEFLVINSDNYYPVSVLQAVAALPGPGLAGFDRASLVAGGNVDDARISQYAVLEVGPDGTLVDVVEKPDAERWSRTPADALISMNCWRFGPSIFEAARQVGPSPRGEYELADAVRIAIRRGERFRVAPVRAGVLDLSQRADIPAVASRLAGVRVSL